MPLRSLAAAVTALAAVICLGLQVAPVGADQLLANGDFESGTIGWTLKNSQPAACAGRTAPGALALARAGSGAANPTATQFVSISAGQGPYTLSGWLKLAGSGSSTLGVRLAWLDPDGQELYPYTAEAVASSAYQPFSLAAGYAPAGASVLQVQLALTTPGAICIDDMALVGPLALPPTPVPTVTLTPLPSDTPTRTPTIEPPTHTPRPATATREPSATRSPTAPSTAKPSKASTASASAVQLSDAITNGGFEAGLSPWLKVGGDLALTGAPVHSGSRAASLTSSTTSTKWAYQVVAVTGGETYEFEGYLRPGPGIAESYLRISWYASPDGSGSALGNTDSTAHVSGPTADFTYLTTGAVAAPPSANSARVRAVMAPVSAAPAVLYLDDLMFGPSTAPARTEALAPASAADDAVGSPAGQTTSADSASTAAGFAAASTATSTTQEVLAAESAPAGRSQDRVSLIETAGGHKHSNVLRDLLTAGFFAAGLGFAVLVARHRRGPA
ncbi:MAG TPA: hypothetical protein VH951_12675 [Dehalococcoidia bacterium]